MVTAFGWRLHRHYRGPQFLIDTTNTGRILLPGQNRIPRLGHHWLLFHGHGHYETICETCAHFVISEDHRQTLTNQLDNATERDEPRRQKVYLELLTRLDTPRT